MQPPAPSPRDVAFREAFLKCAAGDASALATLERLAAEGATTAAFGDDELGAQNFAMAAQDFLSAPSALFLRAAAVTMQRGQAFLTNRAYVGNGGLPAVFFALDLLAGNAWRRTDDSGPPDHALALLELMVTHGLSLREPFWKYFVRSLRPIVDHPARRLALRQRVIELAEAHGAFEHQWEYPEDTPLSVCLRVRDADTLPLLADALARSSWAARLSELDATADALLNPFLSSKRNRRLLHALAARHAFLLQWLTRPAVLFALIRKKERSSLRWLLQHAPEAVRSARDEQGNGALHVLAGVRGKTEGIAELLLSHGVRADLVNAAGERAWAKKPRPSPAGEGRVRASRPRSRSR